MRETGNSPAATTTPAVTSLAVIGEGEVALAMADCLRTLAKTCWISASVRERLESRRRRRARHLDVITGAHSLRTLKHWRDSDLAQPTLVIVATETLEPDRAITEHLMRARLPHLVLRLTSTQSRVGPLVLPGHSPCLHCLDATIVDQHPAWTSRVLTQSSVATPRVSASVLHWTTAVLAHQVRSYLGWRVADSLGCTIEMSLRDPLIRVRRWPRHPDCRCYRYRSDNGHGADH